MAINPISFLGTPGGASDTLRTALTKVNENFTTVGVALNLKADAAAIPSKLSTLTNDAGFVTPAGARAAISVSGSLAYNATTGVISYTAPAAAVASVSGRTGVVVLAKADVGLGNVDNTSDATKAAAGNPIGNALATKATLGAAASFDAISVTSSAGFALTLNSPTDAVRLALAVGGTTKAYLYADAGGFVLIMSTPDGNKGAFNVNPAGQTGFSVRPSFDGATPWDSKNFDPSTKVNVLSSPTFLGLNFGNGTSNTYLYNDPNQSNLVIRVGPSNAQKFTTIGADNTLSTGTIYSGSINASTSGTVALSLTDERVGSTRYRTKQIISSADVDNGDGFLFRAWRSSGDGAVRDYTLTGSSGSIWHSGNFDPNSRVSPNTNVSFASLNAQALIVEQPSDCTLTLHDTSAPANRYRLKKIFSSKNWNGGDGFLFRQHRPSDSTYLDYGLGGPSGDIVTTGNALALGNWFNRNATDEAKLRAYGFVADGQSRPLSSVTSLGGTSTAGWDLTKWRTIFPKAAAISDEIDGCAIQKVWDLNTVSVSDGTRRSAIRIPPGIALISQTFATGDVSGDIEGSGMYATELVAMLPIAYALITHGSPQAPTNQVKRLANLKLRMNTVTDGSCGFWAHFGGAAGRGTCLTIENVIFDRFSTNRVTNAPRGFHMTNVSVFGPDFTIQPYGGFRIESTPDAGGCFSYRFTDVITVNYRWGFDFYVTSPLEGVAMTACASYSGWGMVNVYCTGSNGYKSLLWSFNDCDWEGLGHGLMMRNCRNVSVRGGFYIFNRDLNSSERLPYWTNADLPQGFVRRMIWFSGTEDVKLDHVEFAAASMTNSALVNVDESCTNVLILDSIVRTYSTAQASFMLSGTSPNTTRERGTYYMAWGGGPKTVFFGDANQSRQVSQPEN